MIKIYKSYILALPKEKEYEIYFDDEGDCRDYETLEEAKESKFDLENAHGCKFIILKVTRQYTVVG